MNQLPDGLAEVMEYAFADEVRTGQFPFDEDEARLIDIGAEDTCLKEQAVLRGDELESEPSWLYDSQ